jgi:hypothetical protein
VLGPEEKSASIREGTSSSQAILIHKLLHIFSKNGLSFSLIDLSQVLSTVHATPHQEEALQLFFERFKEKSPLNDEKLVE